MLTRFTEWIEERYNIPPERTLGIFSRAVVMFAALLFAVICTFIVGFEDIFTDFNSVANLTINSVPSEDVVARENRTFVSEILTAQERANARAQVPAVFDPPDPNVARQQTLLTQQIIEYIDNVRQDDFAAFNQQVDDINQITALKLEMATIQSLLQLTQDSWDTVRTEIISVLERVMRQSIRESELQNFRDQLPTQVSVRLSEQESAVVTAITEDLIRPNTFENPEKTLEAQNLAEANVPNQERRFVVGQTIARANEPITELSYEALQELGLLTQDNNQGLRILRAFVASTIVMVLAGLYITRFEPHLIYVEPAKMTLLAIIFLIALFTTRAFGLNTNVYIYPAATVGIIYVAVTSPNVAIIGAIGLAFLAGLMGRGSLEVATLFAAGNISAVLTLRDAGRLNNYFIAGMFVGVTNAAVVAIFSLLSGGSTTNLSNLMAALFSGVIIVPTASFAGMYALTILFNLPTAFKLIDLSQPSKPLLQRLLREAPGTYQHSLQVANLAEQAAEAIGADAQMTHVGALYHDIGKMANPVFFTENQQHVDNPHESLNDPYRSADIIISHVTEGEVIAKKYKLPNRIRDFIMEHHGTTQVFVFYKRAIDRAGSESAVDISDFTYPGPIPQSRETAILMMADSCESAIRAKKPQSNQEITEIVHSIIEGKRNGGQLYRSNLTLNDLQKIEETFIDIFKGLFHPRIDYEKAVQPKSSTIKREATPAKPLKEVTVETESKKPTVAPFTTTEKLKTGETSTKTDDEKPMDDVPALPKSATQQIRSVTPNKTETTMIPAVSEDNPLNEVPPLPKRTNNNGMSKVTKETKKVMDSEQDDDKN